jgi:DNA helicase-2/ATP-dependent DNA helicase PcrA
MADAPSESDLVNKILTTPFELSPDQKKAVVSPSRYHRIIAGAGAGKTETLTRRIEYLLLVKKVKPAAIVAFTFTEKAAQQIKSRVYQRVRELAGEEALSHLGEMYIGTIHAYAQRVLQGCFGYGNYEVLDENQQIAFVMRHGWGTLHIGPIEKYYADSVSTFLRISNMVWDTMPDRNFLAKNAPEFFRKFERYEDLLKRHRQLNFGTMIYLAVKNLRAHPETLNVDHLIVDEYQDINPAQAELIRLVGMRGSIFIVGDPRQCIYQWRGSDVSLFDRFLEEYRPEVTSIGENTRSAKRIVACANSLAQSFNLKEMLATRSPEGFVAVVNHEDPQEEAKWIATEIQRLIKNEKVRLADIGVLTRSVSSYAEDLIEELKARDIPYIVGGKVGLFKRPEAQAMGMIFSWFYRDGFWRGSKYNRTIKGDDLLALALKSWESATQTPPSAAPDLLKKIKEDLNSGKSSFSCFTGVFHEVLNALGFKQLDYRNKSHAAIMANLGRFNVLLTDYEGANRLGGNDVKWEPYLHYLCTFMNSYAVQAYEEQPSDDIRGVEAIQIMTVHQAKGLEWPIVFLFSAVEGRFPSRFMERRLNWMDVPRRITQSSGNSERLVFDAGRYEGSLEDERRLFYVAITRARDALIMSHFDHIQMDFTKSRFIDELDRSSIEFLHGDQQLPAIAVDSAVPVEEMVTYATGEIIRFSRCPHMYLLGELWGYQPQFDPALGYGKGVHFCLMRTVESLGECTNPTEAVAKAMEEFHLPYTPGYLRPRLEEKAHRVLEAYAAKYREDLGKSKEMEYRIEYPSQKATITGRIDVILHDDAGYEVRDYKTSAKVTTQQEAEYQVRLYAVGLRKLGRNVGKGSIVYLESEDVEKVPVDVADERLKQAEGKAADAIKELLDKRFDPTPGEACGRCDQQGICRWIRNAGT